MEAWFFCTQTLNSQGYKEQTGEHQVQSPAAKVTSSSGFRKAPHAQLVWKHLTAFSRTGCPDGVSTFLDDQFSGLDNSFSLSLPSVNYPDIVHGAASVSASQTRLSVRITWGKCQWIQIWGPIPGDSESVALDVAPGFAFKSPLPHPSANISIPTAPSTSGPTSASHVFIRQVVLYPADSSDNTCI